MYRPWILGVLLLMAATVHAGPATILVFGDSISAGYGLADPSAGWVALLQRKLVQEGYGYEVVNASVSGETTAGGLARLPRAIAMHHPKIVILELGGNDGLRALPIPAMQANLAGMVRLSRNSGAEVLLLGMRIPPNYGPEYTAQFYGTYTATAQEFKLPLVPFLLDGIALTPSLMQADDIHPNEQGQPRLLANVWPELKPLLHAARTR